MSKLKSLSCKSADPPPSPPSRRLTTAFFIYQHEVRAEVTRKHPGLLPQHISRLLGKMYENLSPEARQKIQDEAKRAQLQYLEDVKKWESEYGPISVYKAEKENRGRTVKQKKSPGDQEKGFDSSSQTVERKMNPGQRRKRDEVDRSLALHDENGCEKLALKESLGKREHSQKESQSTGVGAEEDWASDLDHPSQSQQNRIKRKKSDVVKKVRFLLYSKEGDSFSQDNHNDQGAHVRTAWQTICFQSQSQSQSQGLGQSQKNH